MDIRWMAVFTGFLVDYALSTILILLASPGEEFWRSPDLSRPQHIGFLALLALSTGCGGYIAGRVARMNQAVHGLLVGVIGILLNQLALMSGQPALPRAFVVNSLLGCLIGMLGGLISLHAQPRPR